MTNKKTQAKIRKTLAKTEKLIEQLDSKASMLMMGANILLMKETNPANQARIAQFVAAVSQLTDREKERMYDIIAASIPTGGKP